MSGTAEHANVWAVVQGGRLQYEALLFAASFRRTNPGHAGRLLLLEPRPGRPWPQDPRIDDPEIRAALLELGAEIIPFTNSAFGADYPQGNKIEALMALPEGEPFVFFDTDTLFLGPLSDLPLDFDRPCASLRRENTWPQIDLYGPELAEIWGALYARFGLDFPSSQDMSLPVDHWQRYLYFNAGFFHFRCPREFGTRFLEIALSIRDDPPPELVCQEIYPWLDQIALPLVIHGFGGGRDVLAPGLIDGRITCHWRTLPLLYARESDPAVAMLEEIAAPNRMKKLLKRHEPFRRLIYQGRGAKARALFDRAALPRREAMIRQRLRKAGLWMR